MAKKEREAFILPNEQCRRLNHSEMLAVRWVLNMASELNMAKGDLAHLLDAVPNGKSRMNMLVGQVNALFTDILGVVSDNQRQVLRNSARDYAVKLVPKVMTTKSYVALDKADFQELVTSAKNKCKYCPLDGKEALKCSLYKLLEAYVPLDDYGNSDISCPYAYEEWKS